MKRAKKVFSYTLSTLAIVYGLILVFPQVLFSNFTDYKNFTVYHHSENINTQKLESILDESFELLSESELFNGEKKQKIFLCNNFNEFAFFAPRSRKSFAVNYPLIQNIFLSRSEVGENRVRRNAEEHNIRTLSGVIAHETTHSLLENNLGILKYKLLPSWKNEGYCDYIAKESSFDELLGKNKICQDNEKEESPSYTYFKYKAYMQYLLEKEKLTIDTVLKQDFDLERVAFKARKENCSELGK